MDIQSKNWIYVGYPESAKGYRLLDLDTRDLIINRSVKFHEHPLHHLRYSYDFPYFNFTSPSNDCSLEEQCDEFILPLPNWHKIRKNSSLQMMTPLFMSSY
jgi:hypothetical protein